MADYTDEQIVARYLELRRKKERAARLAKQIAAGRNGDMEVLEQELLRRMREQGQQHVKTTSGTAYRVTDWSVTTSDKPAFVREIVGRIVSFLLSEADLLEPETETGVIIDAVLDSDALALLDARPVKEAALAYLDEHKVPPPGLDIDGSYGVNVRKS